MKSKNYNVTHYNYDYYEANNDFFEKIYQLLKFWTALLFLEMEKIDSYPDVTENEIY